MKNLSLGLMLILLPGCSLLAPDCPDRVVLRVDGSNPPVFRWDPSCVAERVHVERKSDHGTMWLIKGDLRPPIRYGDLSAGDGTGSEAAPLEAGVSYEVTLWKEGPATLIAEAEFIYLPAASSN